MRILSVLFITLVFPGLLNAQLSTIKGTVTDAVSGETLIGASILYGEGQGVVTDMDGEYELQLPVGTYTVRVSYVGYIEQQQVVTTGSKPITLSFKLKTMTLTEVEVVADVALTRETPVAFSTIQPKEIREELASRDIPMILNKTPGVYATQQGGGDGDARINIRGFNQRNLAVMIDGIPVNDMENGWVYWSNWFGLDAVTRNIQVQRGLGASKLALPSVGGTMNIISSGIETKLGGVIKQELGSDGFMRTSVGVTSGQLKGGWGITFAGSYKQGAGWVDETWTKGWFYYLKIDKKWGRHITSLTAMGAPQQHAQRSYKQLIKTFDETYADQRGIDTNDGRPSYGIKYNANWGYINRWEYAENGERIYKAEPERLPQSLNYYHKPLFSLRDFWRIHDQLYFSNILYASIGQGGGTGTFSSDKFGNVGSSTFDKDITTGLINYQPKYDANMTDPKGQSLGILRSSINNHYWYGLLSTLNWSISESFDFSSGIDIRTYKGEHYGRIYDLLGGSYFLNNSNFNHNQFEPLNEGDKIYYNYDSKVRWGGLFALLEFKNEKWNVFINLTGALSGYQRLDYFRRKDLTLNNTTYTEVVGFGDIFYFNGSESLIFSSNNSDTQYQSNDTTFVVKRTGQTSRDTLYIVDATGYDINSSEASFTRTPWRWFPGFTVKGGANYNIDNKNNIFVNLGYISRAPRFNNVFDRENKEYLEIKNENVMAFEMGYSYIASNIRLNVNGYLTYWKNKPQDGPSYVEYDGDTYPVNINGMNAFHKGIEVEFGWKPFGFLQWDQVAAWGDWRWTSENTAYIYGPGGNFIKEFYFNAKGVHVGDAAQFQLMESLRFEFWKKLYISGSFTLFAKNYSNMDPISLIPDNPNYLDENGKPRDSWKLPIYYLIEVHAGYRFVFDKFKLDIRGSVFNLLNQAYIADAQNNDWRVSNSSDFNAASAGVFFGIGRTYNLSVSIRY